MYLTKLKGQDLTSWKPFEKQSTLSGHLPLLPWLVLILFLVFTCFAWRQTARVADERASSDFAMHVRDIMTGIISRLDTCEQALRGGEGLFAATREVKRGQWHAYVATLKLQEHYPGVLGMGYSMVIPSRELENREARMRTREFSDYALHQNGVHDIHTSVVYLEPISEKNQPALGYDMWAEPVRRKAMERARDIGSAAMSGKVNLSPETGNAFQTGFLLYVPVYGMPCMTLEQRRRALAGWIFALFRMNDLMRGILGERENDFDIEIYDGATLIPENRMYGSLVQADRIIKKKAMFRTVRHLDIAGHAWTLEISSLPGFESGLDRSKAHYVALSGISISILLFLLSWLLVYGRGRAIRFAEIMNRELMESEAQFRTLYDHVPVGVVSVDPETQLIRQANSRFSEKTGYGADELNGMKLSDLMYPEDREETAELVLAMNQGKIGEFHIEKRYVRKDGSIFWGGTLATVIRDEGGRITHDIVIIADINERKLWESALQASEQRLQEILDLMPVALFIKDTGSKIKLMNPACENQWGASFFDLEDSNGSRVFPPEQLAAFLEKDRRVFEGRVQVDFEETVWNARLKENRGVHTYKKPVYDENGEPLYLIGMSVDITEQKAREAELNLAAIVFDIADEAIMITDPDNRIVKVNPAFTGITGFEAKEVIGRNPTLLASMQHDAAVYRTLWEKLDAEGAWRGEIWDRRKNGEIYVEWMSIKVLKGENGEISRFVAMFSDITQRKEDDERFKHLAHYDVLTGLPNRLLFGDRLSQALSKAKREKSELAILFIDLDKFKPINDNFGHDVGDMLLREVAQRLTGSVRESDTVSRLGGDEFVVLIPEVGTADDALNVAEKVLTTIRLPYALAGHTVSISASIGIALFPQHGDTGSDLMRHADVAMYRAKRKGQSLVRFYGVD